MAPSTTSKTARPQDVDGPGFDPDRSRGRRLESPPAADGRPVVTQTHSSSSEIDRRAQFMDLYRESPIPENEQLANVGLFLNRQTFTRLLFLHEMYRHVLDVHGVIMEFGVRWGRDLVALANLRGMYEPYNYLRKVIGFDTFTGFTGVHPADGSGLARVGDYRVTDGYAEYLAEVLDYHEAESPLAHIPKYELVRGDASVTIVEYLERHPETIIALAYFDMDVYKPTRACLEAIRPHLTRGSVIGFDELCFPEFPGETRALMDTFDLAECRLHRSPLDPTPCFMVLE